MVAQGEGRSPMTASNAETDSKPIIIIIIKAKKLKLRLCLLNMCSIKKN